jgi:hypothetical protein
MHCSEGLSCKNSQRTQWARRSLFLLGIGGHSKESGLSAAVSSAHSSSLALANHLYHLVPVQR